ncbi:MAG: DUF1552 domain-containing protein [Luteolibacter sp.]
MNRSARRTFLKGLAATLALPAFPSLAAAASSRALRPASPLRMAFIYAPNGVNLGRWLPADGTHLSPTLEPLAPLKEHFSLLRHLNQDNAFANGDGPGDHARANATFLTGVQARKTKGEDLRLGLSIDQAAAAKIGHLTRLPSLELSTDPPRRSGGCDSGYSCAYQFNLSWRSESTPVPAERDPRLVFEKLFGGGNPEQDAQRLARRKSVLDFVSHDAKRMAARLDAHDRAKLDEYLTAVRDVETRIENAGKFRAAVPEERRPAGIPASYREHIRAMYDLLVLAFQTDSTRIGTFMLAHDGSNRTFHEIGVPDAHHQLSHHRKKPEALESIARIDHFYITEFARFLTKMHETQGADGHSLLDDSMIVYGSGISDGDRHNHDDLPLLLAGHGGGTIQQGRTITAPKDTPMCNLYLSLLDRMGAPTERFGDSTGRLEIIA